MQDKYRVYDNDLPRRPAAEVAAERREQMALELAAREQAKARNLTRQRAIETPPAERIALWESLHGLPLPRDAAHPLMSVIAAGTDLALEQVLEERARREGLAASR